MLIKIFGAIDIFASLLMMLSLGVDANYKLLLFFGIILMIKSGFGMLKDFASWIDFLCGGILILMIFLDVYSFIVIILAILLLQKGAFSFL